MRHPRDAIGFLGLAAWAACTAPPPLPGNAVVGSFAFEAALAEEADDPCALARTDAGGLGSLLFEGTLTVERATGRAFLARPDAPPHEGTLAGRAFSVGASAWRSFDAGCACMEETIRGRIIGEAERLAVGRSCAANADAGDADAAGPPLFTDSGSDALLICGELVEVVPFPSTCKPADAGRCDGAALPDDAAWCRIVYRLLGERRQP